MFGPLTYAVKVPIDGIPGGWQNSQKICANNILGKKINWSKILPIQAVEKYLLTKVFLKKFVDLMELGRALIPLAERNRFRANCIWHPLSFDLFFFCKTSPFILQIPNRPLPNKQWKVSLSSTIHHTSPINMGMGHFITWAGGPYLPIILPTNRGGSTISVANHQGYGKKIDLD